MDASQLSKAAALLGLLLLSLVTLVPHGFSCLRGFLFVSLPSAASAIVTPKCLFVFSNIIVLFLATESKLLSHSRSAQSPGGEDDDVDVVVRELAVFAPPIKQNHAAAEVIFEEERGVNVAAVRISAQQVDQCEEEKEDCEEEATGLPTVDELNKRVEDFIARFNMERQLEARMVVCCC